MPHPGVAENIDAPLVTFPEGRKYYSYTNWEVPYRTYETTENVGENLYYLRSASKHNERDSTGWRAPSAYQFRKWKRTAGYEDDWVFNKTAYSKNYLQPSCLPHTFNITLWDYPGSGDIDSFKGYLKTRALANINSHGFNLAMTWLERKETYRMLVNATWFMRDLLKAIWLRDMRFLGKVANAFGREAKPIRRVLTRRSVIDYWLEYRYGWLPLIRDVYNACKYIEELEDGSYERLRMSTKARLMRSHHRGPVEALGPYYEYRKWYWEMGHSVWKCRFDYRIDNPAYLRLSGLGIVNPVATLFDAVPFSFVLGWFVNIQDFLEGWTSQFGLSFLGGSYTHFGEYREVMYRTPKEPHGVSEHQFKSHNVIFDRWVQTTTPFPELRVRPDLIKAWDPTRFADAIALLGAAVGGNNLDRVRNPRRG